jgi:DNA-binding MarR family transcriptional regulator
VGPLTEEETALWTQWKRASELVRARIVEEITAETGLSDPDFGVLTRVVEDGGGTMRQNQLATSMGYHRSRLSHHLTRMEERGLVTRRQSGDGVEVVVTDVGRQLAAKARPVHAAAVRRNLLNPLSRSERNTLGAVLEKLITPEQPSI